MKNLLLACLLFLSSLIINAQTSAIWTTPTTGTIDGTAFTMTNFNGASITTADFSAADFSAAPLSNIQQCVLYYGESDWTITFASPVNNFKIYLNYWRNDTYVFDNSFIKLSGSSFTVNGNTITVGSKEILVTFANGIIEFTQPITSLSVTALQLCCSFQALTFSACSPSTSSISPTVCNSFTVPSGHETYTTSGTYKDTIPNTHGCDSVITINLTVKHSTASTLNMSVCNSYIVPSGHETYTTSGTYKDTIPNAQGCDSIITINLTVKHSTASTINESVCYSYIVPSGHETYTISGTYKDTIPNAQGCDSVMTINLTIKHSTASTLNESVCNFFIVPSGHETYTTSGTYKDTIPNVQGCDSIITINLTVNQSSYFTINEVVCNSYSVPSGDETYTISGTYKDTIPNAIGCDSIITIILTINNSSYSFINKSACYSYTVPSGDETYYTSGIYKDTISSFNGCDSIITINLSIGNSNSNIISRTACFSYTVPSGDETYTTSGTYMDTIPNIYGCDSIITINLTIITVNTAVTLTEGTLYAVPSGSNTYQWLNCNTGYTKIVGENGNKYTPPVNGKYAVEITRFNCVDTSACLTINNVGLTENDLGTSLIIYPNPTSGKFTIGLGEIYSNVTVSIKNIAGQTVSSYNYGRTEQIDCEIIGSQGFYMLEIYTDEGKNAILKILKE